MDNSIILVELVGGPLDGQRIHLPAKVNVFQRNAFGDNGYYVVEYEKSDRTPSVSFVNAMFEFRGGTIK